MASHWDTKSLQFVLDHYKKDMTSKEIAERLGGNFTRNSIIGKAGRLGLSKQSKRIDRSVFDELAVALRSAIDRGISLRQIRSVLRAICVEG